jgi:hypothetical protein
MNSRAFRIAELILRRSYGEAAPRPDDVVSLPGAPHGLGVSRLGAALYAGAEAAALAVGPLPRRQLSVAGRSGWSGFAPFGGGWLSIALGSAEERALARRCLSTLRAGCTPESAAATLQEWGVAAFVAYPIDATRFEATPAAQRSREPARKPLRGVRVLDCGQLVSAPWAAAVLRAWGASVVSLSHPARVASRRYGSPVRLDLRRGVDRQQFVELCAHSDIVLDNFRHRVWPSLDLDPHALGARIHLSLPAFPEGDERNRLKAYGFQLEGRYGAGHAPCSTAAGALAAPGEALLDHATGFWAAVVAAGALQQGVRARIELPQVELIQLAARASGEG